FEQEAAKRGKNYQLQTSGLIIEFSKLKNDQAGLCHYENPIRIEIDSSYWRKISTVAGADYMKENLIFHEMGHGILKRKHINTILENGDWKSMMCGGDKVDNRPWNINYQGARRDYYVNELFNESTAMPDFLSTQLLVDTSNFVKKLVLTFDTNNKKDTGWDLVTNSYYSTTTENKQLKFISNYTSSYAILLSVQDPTVDIKNNFSFEIEIDCQPKSISDQYGLVFANKTLGTDTTEYFKINREQNMFPGNSSWYSYYTQLTKYEINKSGKNKLKVFKINNIIYYFINNTYVYQCEMEIFGSGNNFGFLVPSGATIWIDNLQIDIKSSSNIKHKVLSTSNLSFKIIELKDNTLQDFNK
ncbi:MAG: hypothetical protein ACOYM7_10415, partial [Paludibacter sp.]